MISLSDGTIVLRHFTNNDIEVLALLANNKNIWDCVRDFLPHPYTTDDARFFIDHCIAENPQLTFAIEYQQQLCGCIGLTLQNDIYRYSAELGYWIGEPFWNKGIATHAVKIITAYGFEQLGKNRIYSGIFDFNKASQRVLEKSGFLLEGILKKSVMKNNVFLDEYRYAITR